MANVTKVVPLILLDGMCHLKNKDFLSDGLCYTKVRWLSCDWILKSVNDVKSKI
jgi:hypothetical protein